MYTEEVQAKIQAHDTNYSNKTVRTGDTTASASAHRLALKARCSVNANIKTYFDINLKLLFGHSKRCETPKRRVSAECIDCFGEAMRFRRSLASVSDALLHPRQTLVK